MSYQAIISVCNISPHPNADKLCLLNISGYQVVSAKDHFEDGELVVFFPEGGQLSSEMCYENSLYRENKGVNKDPNKYGYFESERRIKTLRLRGEKSEGFVTKLSSLSWTEADLSGLKQGQLIDVLNDKIICNKYYTEATLKAKSNAVNNPRKQHIEHFREIGKTSHYKTVSIPSGALIVITEKIHGTSGRTAYLDIEENVTIQHPWYKKLLSRITGETLERHSVVTKKEIISGTRKTICCVGDLETITRPDGSIVPLTYRQEIHSFLNFMVRNGESLYYEIVKISDTGIPDFKQSIPNDKSWVKFRKKYGSNQMRYKYGVPSGGWKIFLYKVTIQDGTSIPVTLSWSQVEARALELGIDTVPVIDRFIYDGDRDRLNALVDSYSEGNSVLDDSHIKEGVCVVIEAPNKFQTIKNKGFDFISLEGYTKDDKSYVDLEEIS